MNRARKKQIDNLFNETAVYECVKLLRNGKSDKIPEVWQRVADEYDEGTLFHEVPYEAYMYKRKEEIQKLAEAFENEEEFEEYMKILDEKTWYAMYKYDLGIDISNAIKRRRKLQ